MSSMKLRITHLEGELAEYRAAFEALLKTKVELAAAVEGQPTREQLVIQVAELREALRWLIDLPNYQRSASINVHLRELLGDAL